MSRLALLTALLCLAVPAIAVADGFDRKGAYDMCVGDNSNGCGRAFSKQAGQGPLALFDDRRRNGTRYTLKITGTSKRTYRRTTESFEGHTITSIVNLSRLPAGSYRARWIVKGKTVGRWSFKLRA